MQKVKVNVREIDFEAKFSVLKSIREGIGGIANENFVGFRFVK